MKTIKETKAELKEMTAEIRMLKSFRKDRANGYVVGLDALRFKARFTHVALCLVRGVPYEVIEPHCRPDNSMLDSRWIRNSIEKIMEGIVPREIELKISSEVFNVEDAENVCHSA